MALTRNKIIKDATNAYIQSLNKTNLPTPEEMEEQLLEKVNLQIETENAVRAKNAKLKLLTELDEEQVAELMAEFYPIVTISCAGNSSDPKYDLLAIYQDTGEDEGTYVTSELEIRKVAQRFKRYITNKDFDNLISQLRLKVPRLTRTIDRNLIAVNNGIFDYKAKQLLPFSSNYVFLTKSHVNYNPSAKNKTIHNNKDNTDWDVESWMDELSDDPEIVELLWQILGAIIRPNVRWNKSAWFYSESGNNGKGTLCELMRSLCGETAYAAIPLSSFGKDFALEPLTKATAIIVDENDVGIFIDKAANLKAVITNDVIPINRKFQTPISYQFFGFMVQCLNEFPRIKDKSDSFYRRQIFIPFTKSFTGHERKYIKDDYLHRKDVLEYVMFKVLNMDYYELNEPQACLDVLSEYKEFNDPVRQFWEETSGMFQWDCLPYTFLYDLYRAWAKRFNPSGSLQGKQKFNLELRNIVAKDNGWTFNQNNDPIRVSHMMDAPETLIYEYDLQNWMNQGYNGKDINKICTTKAPALTRGLIRINSIKPGNALYEDVISARENSDMIIDMPTEEVISNEDPD